MHETTEALEQAIRLVRSGSSDQAIEDLQRIATTSVEPHLVARALRHQADAYRIRCDWEPALELARRSAETAKSADLPVLFAEALNAEAIIHQSRGAFDIAVPLLEEILEIAEDDRIRGSALQNLGSIAAMNKEFETAHAHFAASRSAFRRVGYRRGEMIALINAAAIANDIGDHTRALEHSREAIQEARQAHDYDAHAHASLNFALAMIGLERFEEAEELLSVAFGFFTIEANAYRQVTTLRMLGDLSRKRGDDRNATRCYQHGLEIARRIGASTEATQLEERLAESESNVRSA